MEVIFLSRYVGTLKFEAFARSDFLWRSNHFETARDSRKQARDQTTAVNQRGGRKRSKTEIHSVMTNFLVTDKQRSKSGALPFGQFNITMRINIKKTKVPAGGLLK